MSQIILDEGASPSTPAASKVALFAKTDGLLYSKDDAGNEVKLTINDVAIGVNTTTGDTSKSFTGIPADVTEIVVAFSGVSLSGTSSILVQIGDTGGIENTGYNSTSSGVAAASSTAGFIVRVVDAAATLSGRMVLSLVDPATFTWVASFCGKVSTTAMVTGGGDKSLSAELTQLLVTTVNGTDTFDAGKINVYYRF